MKILIALFTTVVASFAFGQAGEIDPTFNYNPNVLEYSKALCGPDNVVNEIVKLPDGKMILVGDFYVYHGEEIRRIVRITARWGY